MESRQCLQVVTKATGYWVGQPSSRQRRMTQDALCALLIPLILLANWSYTKTAKREILLAHYTKLLKLVDECQQQAEAPSFSRRCTEKTIYGVHISPGNA